MAGCGFATNVAPVPPRSSSIAYLFTTFPKPTETFLQREVAALVARGMNLRLYSLIGGGGTFAGLPVTRFSLWRLLELLWLIPWFAATRWDVFGVLLRGLLTRRAPGWLNFWENMLGAGFAGVYYAHFRRHPPALLHAAWGGAPATAAWILHRLGGFPYSVGAHAYDLYEHGGDWWLDEKLAEARFIHTSTEMGKVTLVARGHPAERIHVIRRGLGSFPALKPLRERPASLHLVAIARLVPKKGLLRQLRIYAALQEAGVPFQAHIVGEGPLRAELEREIQALRLADHVTLTGHLPQDEVWRQLAWADVLLHTGVVATSGDRDGLPNVIPEAMAAGTLVVTSPAAATTEAVQPERTGLLADVDQPAQWVEALLRLRDDPPLAARLQAGARAWVEENYHSARHAVRLEALMREAAR